ncbi:hypothetical protein DICPUDRAFT_10890, partial [Dictyostelium purpureum]
FFSPQAQVAMKHGQQYEDEARDLFAIGNGVNVSKVGILSYRCDNRFKASPDGVIFNKSIKTPLSIETIVEIKCPYRAFKGNTYKGGRTKEDIEHAKAIPVYYLPQLYANMKYSGAQIAYYISYVPG